MEMTPLQELATVVSVIGGIFGLIMVLIKIQLNALYKKQSDLCDRIKEEKEDRKDSAKEKLEAIRDLYDKSNTLMAMQIKTSERIESILELCKRNHQWDHIDRRTHPTTDRSI